MNLGQIQVIGNLTSRQVMGGHFSKSFVLRFSHLRASCKYFLFLCCLFCLTQCGLLRVLFFLHVQENTIEKCYLLHRYCQSHSKQNGSNKGNVAQCADKIYHFVMRGQLKMLGLALKVINVYFFLHIVSLNCIWPIFYLCSCNCFNLLKSVSNNVINAP